jgi:hypothetical protein
MKQRKRKARKPVVAPAALPTVKEGWLPSRRRFASGLITSLTGGLIFRACDRVLQFARAPRTFAIRGNVTVVAVASAKLELVPGTPTVVISRSQQDGPSA